MTHTIFLTLALLGSVALYFLPALLADERKRPDTLMLAMFNFALGWTVVGWVMALYWTLQPVKHADVVQLAADKRHKSSEALFAALGQRGARRAGLTRTAAQNA
jgi:hypothetical protein